MAVESMDKSKEMLELIHDRYKDNLSINEDVKSTLSSLKIEHDGLDEKMEAFKGLAEEAKLAFPTINDNIDLAFPIQDPISKGPVFRITLIELLGVGSGFSDHQLQRALRNPVGPDLFLTPMR